MIRLARATKVTRMAMEVRVAGCKRGWFAKVTRSVRVARVERIGDLGGKAMVVG